MRFAFMLYCCLLALFFSSDAQCLSTSLSEEVKANFQQLVETNSCPNCNLAGAVFNRLNLAGANLAGANLSGAQFYLADLAGADLQNVDLQGAALGGADLGDADLRGANLTDAVLEGAYLVGARMDGTVTARRPHLEEGGLSTGDLVNADNESNPQNGLFLDNAYIADANIVEKKITEQSEERVQHGSLVKKEVVSKKEEPGRSAGAEKQKKKPKCKPLPEKSKKLVMLSDVVVSNKTITTGKNKKSAGSLAKKAPQDNVAAEKQVVNPMASSETENLPDSASVENEIPEQQQLQGGQENSAVQERLRRNAFELEKQDRGSAGGDSIISPKKQMLVEKLLDDNRCVACDLSGVDLSGRSLKEADLERVNFQGADLRSADLREANLKGANLQGADLREADLREADLYRANLNQTNLTGAEFEEALIDMILFSGAIGADFEGALREE